MSEHLNRARQLHQAIHKVLIEEWDPIGVVDIPDAQDEYDSYIPTIYGMLISNKTSFDVFEYLWWLETEHMGLCGDKQKTKKNADKLISLINPGVK